MFWEDWAKKPFETNSASNRPRLLASKKLDVFFRKKTDLRSKKPKKSPFFIVLGIVKQYYPLRSLRDESCQM